MYKCKEIVVTIFKMSLKVHPQNKMLLKIQIHKWNRFQEQFCLSLWHQPKLGLGVTIADKFKQKAH